MFDAHLNDLDPSQAASSPYFGSLFLHLLQLPCTDGEQKHDAAWKSKWQSWYTILGQACAEYIFHSPTFL